MVALAILLSGLNVFAQEQETLFKTERRILFDGDSVKQKFVLPIDQPVNRLSFDITSSIQGGEITIEIYDPAGIRQGRYSVGTQIATDPSKNGVPKEIVNGTIQKYIDNPINGSWQVVFLPAKTNGTINMGITQTSN